jgi:AcrR family transcriptional regulator
MVQGMVGCGLRERKKEATHAAIQQAALDLFEQRGFDATTVEDIAGAAGVSARTFFRYFDSKIDLVVERKEHSPDHPEGHLGALLTARPADEPPLVAMQNMAQDALTHSLAEGGDVLMRQLRIVLATPSLRALALEHFNDHRAELAAAFATRLGASADDLAPRVLAAVVSETLWVVVETWVTKGAHPDELGPLLDDAFVALRDRAPAR